MGPTLKDRARDWPVGQGLCIDDEGHSASRWESSAAAMSQDMQFEKDSGRGNSTCVMELMQQLQRQIRKRLVPVACCFL